MRNMRNIFKKSDIQEDTYAFKEVKTIIDNKLTELNTKFPFVKINNNTAFKHYKNKESYHFNITIKLDMEKDYLSEKYHAKGMDFPIEFDIDVEHATKQYVDYTINDIFMKFNALVDAVKSEYDNYKRPETVDKNKKDNMIV